MTTDLYGINKLLCPICGNLLTSDEYEHAIEEIKLRLGEEYQQQIQKERSEFEEQIHKERTLFQEKSENIKKNHDEQLNVIRTDMTALYNQQLEEIKRNYQELDLQRQKTNKEALENKLAEYERNMTQLNMEVKKLQQEKGEIKENALSDARRALQNDLHSKDIEIRERDEQLKRCQMTIDELKKQMSKTQPELKGEAGEQDLLDSLREKFPEDQFSRQTRGIREGDIIQHIRTQSGAVLKIPIVYDNKEVARITKREIEKQQYYKEHEGTDYLLVVSPNLPKSIKNGVLGKKEGVMLVSRDNVEEVAELLRNAIIEICKSSESKKDLESKQARIYDYILSREFSRKLESIDTYNSDMIRMQDKEEKDHLTLWKKRKAIIQRSRGTYIAISSEIDAIIHEQIPSIPEKQS